MLERLPVSVAINALEWFVAITDESDEAEDGDGDRILTASRRSLTRFALVCRAWSELVNWVIFGEIEPTDALIARLDASPRLWPRVNRVTLYQQCVDPWFSERNLAAVLRSARNARSLAVVADASALGPAFFDHCAVHGWRTLQMTLSSGETGVRAAEVMAIVVKVVTLVAPTLCELALNLSEAQLGPATPTWPPLPRLVHLNVVDAPPGFVPVLLRSAPMARRFTFEGANGLSAAEVAGWAEWPTHTETLVLRGLTGPAYSLGWLRTMESLTHFAMVAHDEAGGVDGIIGDLPSALVDVHLAMCGNLATLAARSLLAIYLALDHMPLRLPRLKHLAVGGDEWRSDAGSDALLAASDRALQATCDARGISLDMWRYDVEDEEAGDAQASG